MFGEDHVGIDFREDWAQIMHIEKENYQEQEVFPNSQNEPVGVSPRQLTLEGVSKVSEQAQEQSQREESGAVSVRSERCYQAKVVSDRVAC